MFTNVLFNFHTVFLFYVMTTEELEGNIRNFADVLRKCGINVVCDFYEVGIEDRANFDGHLWIQQKINECIDGEGYVLVDVTNGPLNDLSHNQEENPRLKMQFTRFDGKTLYQNVIDKREYFIPFCLDTPRPEKVFCFQKDSIYPIYITEFDQSFTEFKETNYFDEFNVDEDSPEALKKFLNSAPDRFQPLADLIRHLTSQQSYMK